ncbi:MAG: hypothetical protein OHK0029_09670 [Armatimonadaceae bacterium]
MGLLTYNTGFSTDKGQQRSHNEDAGAVLSIPATDVAFVVCDGMGGLRSGDVASTETVRVVERTLTERFAKDGTRAEPFAVLGDAFRRANDHVNALNERDAVGTAADDDTEVNPRPRGEEGLQAVMGTTCVAGVVQGNTLYLAHAGDSRAYLWRRGHLKRLTEDHSFVAERVKAGDMTEAEAKVSRFRNMITRAIGIDAEVDPEFHSETLEPGDTLLVCSDGLTTMLEDSEIAAEMNAQSFLRADSERAAGMLVAAANRRGGHDNITVLLVRAQSEQTNAQTVVLDMDAPAPVRRTPAVVWLVLGMALLALVVAALLYFLPSLRQQAIGLLSGPAVKKEEKPAEPSVDYARLVYDPPVRFADLLARGDLLTYSPGVGLYFVASASGKVALLSPEGVPLRSVEELETKDTDFEKAVPATQVYMTSDPQGNVYLSYTREKKVEKVGTDGQLLATIKGFQRPEAIAVDPRGNIFVVDYSQIKICRARTSESAPATSPAYATPSPAPKPTASPASGSNRSGSAES